MHCPWHGLAYTRDRHFYGFILTPVECQKGKALFLSQLVWPQRDLGLPRQCMHVRYIEKWYIYIYIHIHSFLHYKKILLNVCISSAGRVGTRAVTVHSAPVYFRAVQRPVGTMSEVSFHTLGASSGTKRNRGLEVMKPIQLLVNEIPQTSNHPFAYDVWHFAPCAAGATSGTAARGKVTPGTSCAAWDAVQARKKKTHVRDNGRAVLCTAKIDVVCTLGL